MSRALERFARFGRAPLDEADQWALAMASHLMGPEAPAAELFLTKVASLDCYVPVITRWAQGMAQAYARTPIMQPGGLRKRCPVEGYQPEWGAKAVADGLTLALFDVAPPIITRARELGVGTTAYLRIRDHIASTSINITRQFSERLEWACGERFNLELSATWEAFAGLNRDGNCACDMHGETP